MSDTPKVDAAEIQASHLPLETWVVESYFARVLERELNEARRQYETRCLNAENDIKEAVTEATAELNQQLENTKSVNQLIVTEACLANRKLLASQLREQRLREALQIVFTGEVTRDTCDQFGIDFKQHECGCEVCARTVSLCPATKSSITSAVVEKALSTPSDTTALKEIKEALEKAYEERYRDNQQGHPFELSFAKHVKHALTLLGGKYK